MPISTITKSPYVSLRLALRLAALLVAPLAVACNGTEEAGEVIVFDACQPTQLRLAPDTSQTERDGVSMALTLWQAAGGPPLEVLPASAVTDPAQVLPIGFESAAPAFFGLYRPSRGDILINRQLDAPQARAITIAHEIGHAFGLPHVSDHRSLMNPGNLQVPPGAEESRLIFQRSGTCPR